MRTCLLIPFYNYTVEYELQKYLKLYNSSYYVYKIPYETSVSVNPLQFYDELLSSAKMIIRRLSKFRQERVYVLCASFMAFHNNAITKDYNIIDLLVMHCRENNIKEVIIYSPYDKRIDKKIIATLNSEKIIIRKIVKIELSGSANYFEFGLHALEKVIVTNSEADIQNVVLCTNIPTLHLTSNPSLHLVSSNSLLIEDLKRNDNYNG